MTNEERTEKIESYGKAYDEVSEALKNFPEEMWKFKPAENKWSIHEVIIHLADSEANSYIRCRRFIAESGKNVMAYDENVWAQKLKYHEQNTEDALRLFKFLRKMSYDLIKNLPEKTWNNLIDHPENGLMTFEQWLEIYENHTHVHIAQMQRNYDQYKNEKMK